MDNEYGFEENLQILHNVLHNLQNSFIVNKGEDCVFGSTEFLKYYR